VITAVDSSVLLDVFGADLTFGAASREAVRRCRREGGLVACEIVWAEVGAAFGSAADACDAMERLGVRFVPQNPDTAAGSGQLWRSYRRAGGSRQRVVPDFLIGVHAVAHADRLLSRDRGFFRDYFADLVVLDPTPGPPAPRG
jgi:predicted nucleic acid-binding protein